MAKNERGTWVGTSMQPSFQSYPTAGMLQGGGSSTPTAPPPTTAPPPPVTPPPATIPPLTPNLPLGNTTITPGGGYPIVNDIVVPNDYYSMPPTQPLPEVLGPGPVLPELPIPAPRLKLIDAVMERTSGPQIGAANNSTLRQGVGGLYNIRRNY